MLDNPFPYSAGLYFTVLFLSVLFKRLLGISYDKKLLLSNTIAFLVACTAFLFFKLDFNELDHWDLPTKILGCVAVIFIGNALIQFVFWLIINFFKKTNLAKLPRFVFDIMAFLLIIGLIFFCTKFILNKELTGLLITSTVFSAVIGLALQGTLSNLFSGLALQVASPFKLHDWVNLGGHEGEIISQNWRSITLLTRENHRVSLTNRFVSEDVIINYSKPSRRELISFIIVLDYSHPPNEVKQIMRDLINEMEEIDLDPINGPVVVDYMDSGIKYAMKYWIHDYADIVRIEDKVLTRLWYKLKREDIIIPYPTQSLQMHMMPDPPKPKTQLSRKSISSFLSKRKWLKSMDKEKIDKLAKQCEIRLYAQNDLIVRQNDSGDSMFIIYTGSTDVLIKSEKGKNIKIADKRQGEFFGEMSLLTGEKRTASIVANQDCIVLIINRMAFKKILYTDKKLLSQFIDGLEENKSGIAKAIYAELENSKGTQASAKERILSQIKSYLMID